MQRLNRIMAREIERIRAAAPGERNATLNKVAYTLAGYAHLGLEERDAQQECNAAGIAAGLEPGEIARSFRSGWDGGIKHPCEIIERPYKEILYDFDSIVPAIDVEFLNEQPILPPDIATYDGRQDLIRYLEAVFEPEEFVGYCISARYQEDKNKWIPASAGSSDRTAGQLLAELRAASEIGAVLGDPEPDAGAWIRFNPLDGNGVKDKNITSYRYALVEGDDGEIDRQAAIYEALQLPCAAIVHSAGKSLHAIVRIDAADLAEYRRRVKYLYAVMEKNGMVVDTQNKNPSRLSRLPGVERAGKPQFLLHTNTGKPDWESWKEYIEELNDDLPDFEPIKTVWDDMPLKSPELIAGILRQGHKMLLAGPSKAGKSFLLLELAICIAEGKPWLGFPVRQGKVLYVNLELDHASCLHRIKDLYQAMDIEPQKITNLVLWQLRGKAVPLDKLAAPLIRRAKTGDYTAIIIDPLYKILTGDENSAHEMAMFCNHFDRICAEIGCSTIYCHHHSKGSQGQKRSGDRASGSGVFLRDPDALIDLIELELHDGLIQAVKDTYSGGGHQVSPTISAWRIEGTLREFPPFGQINLFFDYPLHYADSQGLLVGQTADGERGGTQTPSKKERIRNAVKAMDGDLTAGVSITELCQYAGMDEDDVIAWCSNAKTPYTIGFDGLMRTESVNRPRDLLWAFSQIEGDVTPLKLGVLLKPNLKRPDTTIVKWLEVERKLFHYEPKKPVKITKYGEQKLAEFNQIQDNEVQEDDKLF